MPKTSGLNKKNFFCESIIRMEKNFNRDLNLYEDKEFTLFLQKLSDDTFDEFVATLSDKQREYTNALPYEGSANMSELSRKRGVTVANIRQLLDKVLRKAYRYTCDKLVQYTMDLGKDLIFETDEVNQFMKPINRRAKERHILTESEKRLSASKSREDKMSVLIESLELSGRTYLSLKRAGINTVGQLLELSAEEVLQIRSIGRVNLEDLKQVLKRYNLHLKGEQTDE